MSDKFFDVWFAICAVVSLGMLGLTVWAVITVVQWLVQQ